MTAITSRDYEIVFYKAGGGGEDPHPLREFVNEPHFYTVKVRGRDVRDILDERDNARAQARYYKEKYKELCKEIVLLNEFIVESER